MRYETIFTDKKPCEICGEKKLGCRVVWDDDEIVGVTCKKDISEFAKKHNITEYL